MTSWLGPSQPTASPNRPTGSMPRLPGPASSPIHRRGTTTYGLSATPAGARTTAGIRSGGAIRRKASKRPNFANLTRQIMIPLSLPPIGVRSAFGGLGLYKMRFALGARYRGVDARGREVSEHVAFNETIGRAGGQFHIFPPLMVRAPQEHLYRASDFPRRWRWAMFRQR